MLELILVLATLLGGFSAVWFFWDKWRARKPLATPQEAYSQAFPRRCRPGARNQPSPLRFMRTGRAAQTCSLAFQTECGRPWQRWNMHPWCFFLLIAYRLAAGPRRWHAGFFAAERLFRRLALSRELTWRLRHYAGMVTVT